MAHIILIGQGQDLKLSESHPKEYGDVRIITKERALLESNKYFGAVPEVGGVFIKHPYADCYIANNDLLDINIVGVMIREITTLAKKLGALSVWSSIKIAEKKWLLRTTSLEVEKGTIKTGVSSKREKTAEKIAQLTRESTLANQPLKLTEDEYKDARLFYEQSKFLMHCDVGGTCRDMVDFRNPASRLQEGKETMHFTASVNLTDELQIAGSLEKAPILKAKAGFSQKKKYSKSFEIIFHANFAERDEHDNYSAK